MKLSVIIPCYNEEKNIRECLESVAWADEILVVDSFSTDKTLEIARKYTDRIVQHEFVNDSVQKNWAIPQAAHEWILIVDCDERVPPELRDEILDILAQSPSKDGYWVKRKNYLMGRHVTHSGWGRDTVLRFFRKSKGRYEEKRVHGEIHLDNTGTLNSFFDHYTVSSIGEWVNKINRYTSYKGRTSSIRGAGSCHPYDRQALRCALSKTILSAWAYWTGGGDFSLRAQCLCRDGHVGKGRPTYLRSLQKIP
jgi:glycosyltransferase involved in cell wall biosynthesis